MYENHNRRFHKNNKSFQFIWKQKWNHFVWLCFQIHTENGNKSASYFLFQNRRNFSWSMSKIRMRSWTDILVTTKTKLWWFYFNKCHTVCSLINVLYGDLRTCQCCWSQESSNNKEEIFRFVIICAFWCEVLKLYCFWCI